MGVGIGAGLGDYQEQEKNEKDSGHPVRGACKPWTLVTLVKLIQFNEGNYIQYQMIWCLQLSPFLKSRECKDINYDIRDWMTRKKFFTKSSRNL